MSTQLACVVYVLHDWSVALV